jgi:hypothetical protein
MLWPLRRYVLEWKTRMTKVVLALGRLRQEQQNMWDYWEKGQVLKERQVGHAVGFASYDGSRLWAVAEAAR